MVLLYKENPPTSANAQKALFEALLQAAFNAPRQQIIPRLEDGPAPLSFAQQRLWFFDQLEPGNTAYNIFRAFRLTGELNPTILEKCLNEIVNRHDSLRTIFITVDGQPAQVILPNLTISLPVVNLRDLPEPEREAQIAQYITQESQRVFNLSQGPLLRVTLLQLADKEQILLLVAHHLITDGWSIGVLFRELSALYNAYLIGKPSPLAPLPIQYPDFTVWQREWLPGEALEAQLSYWKRRLAGHPPVLNLPTDHPRPAIQTFRGRSQSTVITKTLAAKLKDLSQKEGVTLFMTLLAAFQTLLYRYTGQDDILVGSPVAGRTRIELEGLIGLFINTLVLRTDLSGNPTFQTLLGRVRETALGAYNHQELPFEKLVEELQPARDLSLPPLFQVMFNMHNFAGFGLEIPGLTVEHLSPPDLNAQFDLTLNAIERNEEIHLKLVYNIDLFEPATITRMLSHLEVLLEAIVANPNQPLLSLPLLTEDERYQLLVGWNERQREHPRGQCIHQLFEAQVERTPEAVAVVFENERLTYRQLNTRANQLAHYLKRQGVGPEMMVGMYLDRSLEMVVAILGILKAGGVYVPLDLVYPKERLAFMLQNTQAVALLTESRLLENLPKHQTQVVCLDKDWEVIARESKENPAGELKADSLAYVIYTSGSTGKPKGVLISHYNVIRLFEMTQPWFHFDSDDVWTLFHSYAFDFSVWEIWGALLYGGRLVVVPFWVSRSPEAFYDLLSAERVTILNQTPSAFRQLIRVEDALDTAKDLALRFIIFGGEALEINSLKPWFDRHGDQRPELVNMYGITETTVHVTYRPIKIADLHQSRGSVIGKPIPDLHVYLLDEQLQPVPLGVTGELYVGGAGLALGYLNRPELTAERFISDPFNGQSEARLYRSGDLARRLSNGDIEYLGRIDHQVKIRGFRIELREIEAVLGQYPDVQESVVIVREDIPNDKRLVTYLVPGKDAILDTDELRSFLRQSLPDYMVPSAFVVLEKLPLTPNGKVDRKALPVPDQSRPDLENRFVAPRTEIEEIMVKIWAEILGVERVGIHDNFFDLGGHSLLATQVVFRIFDAFDIRVPLRSLFETPTIAGLAKQIETISRMVNKQAAADGKMDNREEIVL